MARLPTRFHAEPVNGGLVTSKDPSLLGEGQLMRCDNAIYRPYSDALWSIGARQISSMDQIPGSITGLVALPHHGPGESPLFIAAAGSKWYYMAGVDGTWTELVNFFAPFSGPLKATFSHEVWNGPEITDWSGYWFISDLFHPPKVLQFDWQGSGGNYTPVITLLQVGMNGLYGSEVGASTAAGSWDEATGPGTFFYWITEYDYDRDLEGTWPISPGQTPGGSSIIPAISVDVTDPSTQKVELTIHFTDDTYYPQILNQNATHWRVYRGPAVGGGFANLPYYPWSPFPIGEQITVLWTPGTGSQYGTFEQEVTEIPIPGGSYDPGVVPQSYTVDDKGYLPTGRPYPVTVITDPEGSTAAIPRDTRPAHSFSTSEIFEDSLVVNDTTDTGIMRYSAAGKLQSFPSIYWIDFKTENVESITCLRRVNSLMVVGTTRKIWRLTHLPRPTDPIFTSTGFRDMIVSDHGVVGLKAHATFTPDGAATHLAYVHDAGINVTDGYTTRSISLNLDWEKIYIDSGTWLINAEHLKSLILYYATAQGGNLDHALFLSYAPRHLMSSGFKVSGPCSLPVSSVIYSDSDSTIYAGGMDGYLYKDDQVPVAQPTSPTVLPDNDGMTIQTRYIHAAGLHNEMVMSSVRAITDAAPFRGQYAGIPGLAGNNLRVLKRDANQPEQPVEIAKTINAGGIWKGSMQIVTEGASFEYRGFSPLHMLGFEYTTERGL